MGTFHVIIVILFAALIAIRLRFHFKAGTWRREGRTAEGVSLLLRFFVGIPLILCILVYLFRPQILAWASVPLDPIWRRIGAAIFGLSLPFLIWVQQALGRNFSTDLFIRSGHTLVTWGPYRYVRHPMYTVLLLTFTGMGLLTANWFIGGAGIVVLIVINLRGDTYHDCGRVIHLWEAAQFRISTSPQWHQCADSCTCSSIRNQCDA